jgi:TIR domain
MPHDAFISYSSHDKTAADAACAALEASGVRCWIAPRDITPGVEWGAAIIDAINQSRVLVLIFSARANGSPQIRREVERAVHKAIPIIPLRIEDIAPTDSLEYFIGTVHWLDALTPPLEAHLRRLTESVKALLKIAAPERLSPPPQPRHGRRMQATVVAAIGGLVVLAAGLWWLVAAKLPPAQPLPPTATRETPPAVPPVTPTQARIDPAVVGTFALDTVGDGYNWSVVQSIFADGTWRSAITQEEDGTYSAANGGYRTVGAKTGRVRLGTYRAVGNAAIEVKNSSGAAVFHPADPAVTVDQAHPVMLGTWRATIERNGMSWTLTIQNNSDGTFHYRARAEDNGTCVFADQKWRTVSAITGTANSGTYRVVDGGTLEITGANGPTTWRRQ